MANYLKRHVGSTACAERKRKRDRERVVEKTKMNAFKFFGPRREPVPPTVVSPPRIHATPLQPQVSSPMPLALTQINPPPTPPNSSSQLPPCPTALQVLEQFRMKIKSLPQSVPEASDSHPIAAFSFNPMGCVADDEDAWEKWDGPLNTLLQWDPVQLRELVVRGKKGLNGLYNFLWYLVTVHGISGALIEMKIERLLKAIEEVYVYLWTNC